MRHPRLVEPAQQIAGDDLYVRQVTRDQRGSSQFRGGDVEMGPEWPYDFATHHRDDPGSGIRSRSTSNILLKPGDSL